jgi:hypothetical protein
MATSIPTLATAIATGIGQSFVTQQVTAFATGVLDELTQNGSATFGNIPGPHPISGLTGASMASRIVAAAPYPFTSPELVNFCTAIADHINNNGVVTYAGPPPAPPGLQPPDAWFQGGTVSGVNGPLMATEVAAAVGYPFVSTQLIGKCTAIADHINNNAEVESGVIS